MKKGKAQGCAGGLRRMSYTKEKSLKSRILAIALAAALAVTGAFSFAGFTGADEAQAAVKSVKMNRVSSRSIVFQDQELRGLWVGFCDFYALGLSNKSEKTFTKNAKKLMKNAKKNGCNVIFFHVRAFDDASWKSKKFPASKYLTSRASRSKSAYKTYSYDPLEIMIREAHAKGLELHAWMNPYRITQSTYLDPAKLSSRNRVLKAIKELQEYDIDGIHFDDYFYHGKRYVKSSKRSKRYKVRISAKKKRQNVNKLIKAAYKQTHKQYGVAFGVSPQGNYENDMNDGADVKTWLRSSGYIDYLIPQIYWSDKWGSRGRVKMYTKRLNQFMGMKRAPGVKMYIGLALYRTGIRAYDDKGWKKSSYNMKNQVKKLRAKGADGYSLFSAPDLTKKHAKAELKHLRQYLGL